MDVIAPEYSVISYHSDHDIGLEENEYEAKVTLFCRECAVDICDFTPLTS